LSHRLCHFPPRTPPQPASRVWLDAGSVPGNGPVRAVRSPQGGLVGWARSGRTRRSAASWDKFENLSGQTFRRRTGWETDATDSPTWRLSPRTSAADSPSPQPPPAVTRDVLTGRRLAGGGARARRRRTWSTAPSAVFPCGQRRRGVVNAGSRTGRRRLGVLSNRVEPRGTRSHSRTVRAWNVSTSQLTLAVRLRCGCAAGGGGSHPLRPAGWIAKIEALFQIATRWSSRFEFGVG
jgi:hypothetical protein